MQKISCPLCGTNKYKILYPSTLTKDDFDITVLKNHLKNTLDDYTKHGQIVRCKKCSLVYTNPMENLSYILEGYKEVVDEEYLKTEKFRKLLLLDHLDTIEKLKKRKKLLDVGCFAGFFLELAKKRGWKTFGIEPSTWASAIAKKKGATILGNDIETTKLPSNFFDAVTLWDVIEHLAHPNNVIKIIHKSLKKGGVIALATPNIDSLLAKILGSRYPFLIRMHLILYSPKTLRRLLEAHGFQIIYTGNYSRVFPISYILDRIRVNNKVFQKFKKYVTSIPKIAKHPIGLTLGDTFIMATKKR